MQNNNSREERNLTRERGREDGRRRWKEWKNKTGITALNCLLLILPALHTKTFDAFSAPQPYTSNYSHTLRVIQTHTTWRHTFTGSRCFLTLSTLLVRQHEICPSLEVEALVCFIPASLSYLLSSILHGSALLWGPVRPLCRSMACG